MHPEIIFKILNNIVDPDLSMEQGPEGNPLIARFGGPGPKGEGHAGGVAGATQGG